MFEAQEYAKTISQRLGYAVFAVVMIGSIFAENKVPAFHWWLMCVMFGFFAYSISYAAVFAWTAKEILDAVEEVSKNVPSEPTQKRPQPQPVQKQQETSQDDEQVRLWRNGLFRTSGGNIVPIPDDVSVDHLIAISKAVRVGKLHDGMSPNKLDSDKVVSRNIDEPNAYTVVEFLVEAGVLKDNGARTMYTWTETGRRVFGLPSPAPTNYPIDFSRAPEVTRRDTTNTTGYATNATG